MDSANASARSRSAARPWIEAPRAEAAELDEDNTARSNDEPSNAVETESDIRESAAAEPAPVDEDDVRVPSADETADAVTRANRALAEMRAREDADAREEAAHRAEQLAQWQDTSEVGDSRSASVTADDVEFDDAGV